MGGMFGAIGVLAALYRRERDGRGETVQSALFENNVFLVAQHMMQYAVTGQPAAPMPIAHLGLGRLRRVRVRRRRADLPRRRLRHAVGGLLRRVRVRRPEGRPAPRRQQPARAGARLADPRTAAPHRRPRRGRGRGAVRAPRPAVRADHAPRGPVRRSAPARHRRPGRGDAARRRERGRRGRAHARAAAAAGDRRRAPAAANAAPRAGCAQPGLAARNSATTRPRSPRCWPTGWSPQRRPRAKAWCKPRWRRVRRRAELV